ncbi:MAG: FYVE zinc finger domain-containing protein [archaeon]|nr:FYVE zinc finger domain-containing protein [archaeon]
MSTSTARTDDAARTIQGAWRRYVARRELTNRRKANVKRKHAALEILTTEQSYCRTLDLVVEKFLLPVREGRVLSPHNQAAVFSNIEDIRSKNKELLAGLEAALKGAWSNSTKVGPVFSQMVPELRLYTEYCANYNHGCQRLEQKRDNNAKFAAFLDKTTLEVGNGINVPLQSYLIQPVQRIPRYRLLLHELLKATPEGHVDYKPLTAALSSVQEIAVVVNESIREAEYMNQMVEFKKKFSGNVPELLAPKRFLIREGTLMKVCRKEPKPRQFFLLNDNLIYATQQLTPTPTGGRYRFHQMLPLQYTTVVDIPDKPSSPSQKNAFQFLSKTKSFTVFAESPEEKAQWIADVQKALSSLPSAAASGTPDAAAVVATGGANTSVAPVWAPDQESKVCLLCEVRFTTLNRRHHCRHCGTLCCGACSSQKAYLPNMKKTCRVCFKCFETITGKPAPVKKTKGSLRKDDLSSSSLSRLPSPSRHPSTATSLSSDRSPYLHEKAIALPSVPISLPPDIDPDDLDYTSGSDFYDSEDELWEPPSKPPPRRPI